MASLIARSSRAIPGSSMWSGKLFGEKEMLKAWRAIRDPPLRRSGNRIDAKRAWNLRKRRYSWPEVTRRLGVRENGMPFKVSSVINAVHAYRREHGGHRW